MVGATGYFERQVRAGSVDEAEQRLRDLYGQIHLDGIGGYAEQVRGDDRFRIAEMVYDGDLTVEAELDSVVLVHGTQGHQWFLGDDGADLSDGPAVFQPGQPMGSGNTGTSVVTTVTFPLEPLTRFAEAHFAADTRIWFDHPRPTSAPFGHLWESLITVINTPEIMRSELLRANAYEAAAVAAFDLFPLGGERPRRTLTAESGQRIHRRASQFIDEHLSLPITVADVAGAVGVTVTVLAQVFREHSPVGATPGEQLRSGRIAAAHHDLLAGDPARGDTVSDIAHRWGFIDLDRFTREYHQQYGHDPDGTLEH